MTQVKCPICGELVTLTYEENRIYQIECKDCELVIRKKECSRESARIYFELINSNRDSWKARAEKAEAELKEAVKEVERQIHCRGIYGCSDCANSLCYYKGGNQPCKPNWRGQEGSK